MLLGQVEARCFGDGKSVSDGTEGAFGVGQYVAIAHAELPDDLGTNAVIFCVHARGCFLAGMLNALVSVQLIEDAPSLTQLVQVDQNTTSDFIHLLHRGVEHWAFAEVGDLEDISKHAGAVHADRDLVVFFPCPFDQSHVFHFIGGLPEHNALNGPNAV